MYNSYHPQQQFPTNSLHNHLPPHNQFNHSIQRSINGQGSYQDNRSSMFGQNIDQLSTQRHTQCNAINQNDQSYKQSMSTYQSENYPAFSQSHNVYSSNTSMNRNQYQTEHQSYGFDKGYDRQRINQIHSNQFEPNQVRRYDPTRQYYHQQQFNSMDMPFNQPAYHPTINHSSYNTNPHYSFNHNDHNGSSNYPKQNQLSNNNNFYLDARNLELEDFWSRIHRSNQNNYQSQYIQPFNQQIPNQTYLHNEYPSQNQKQYRNHSQHTSQYIQRTSFDSQTSKNQTNVVHFDATIPQDTRQKSDVQLLLDQINQVNSHLKQFMERQLNSYQDIERTKQLFSSVSLISQLIEQNYKLYHCNQNQRTQFPQQLSNHISSYLPIQKNQNQKFNPIFDFNAVQLIDYQSELDKLIIINKFYSDQFDVLSNQRNSHNELKQKLSSKFSLNIFIQLVSSVSHFYSLKHLLKNQQVKDKISKSTSSLSRTKDCPPLLVLDILWHLQTIRLLTKSYQCQLQLYLLNKTEQIQAHTLLTSIKHKSIELFGQLQDLMVLLLEQIMVSSQEQHDFHQNQNNHDKVWFFYYEHPQFNRKWISVVLDTLLQYQMLMDINVFDQSHQKQGSNTVQKQIHNINNSDEGQNSRGYLKSTDKIKDKENRYVEPYLSSQVSNNLLSILSFLLHSHTHNKNIAEINPINQLLQQPVKQIIVKYMKQYQNQMRKLEKTDEKTQSIRRCMIEKYLLVQKITSIVSFFTSKLTLCKSNQQPTQAQKKQNNFGKKKVQRNSNKNQIKKCLQSSYNFDLNYNTTQCQPLELQQDDEIDKQPTKKEDKFSVQLKVMEMTLFVRQMTDILMSDGIEVEKQQNDKNNETTNSLYEKIQAVSVQSVLNKLFKKTMNKKTKIILKGINYHL